MATPLITEWVKRGFRAPAGTECLGIPAWTHQEQVCLRCSTPARGAPRPEGQSPDESCRTQTLAVRGRPHSPTAQVAAWPPGAQTISPPEHAACRGSACLSVLFLPAQRGPGHHRDNKETCQSRFPPSWVLSSLTAAKFTNSVGVIHPPLSLPPRKTPLRERKRALCTFLEPSKTAGHSLLTHALLQPVCSTLQPSPPAQKHQFLSKPPEYIREVDSYRGTDTAKAPHVQVAAGKAPPLKADSSAGIQPVAHLSFTMWSSL